MICCRILAVLGGCNLVISRAEESSVWLLCARDSAVVIIKLPSQHNSATLPRWTPGTHAADLSIHYISTLSIISTGTDILLARYVMYMFRFKHYVDIDCIVLRIKC